MPELNEQLAAIAKVRLRCRQHEENLYGARIGGEAIKKQLIRAHQGQTAATDPGNGDPAGTRAKIAEIDARMAALRDQVRGNDEVLRRLDEQTRLAGHLERSAQAARGRAARLQEQLDELRRQDPLPKEQISQIEAALQRLQASQQNLERSMGAASQQLPGRRDEETALRRTRGEASAEMERLRESLRGLQNELVTARRPVFADVDALEAMQRELQASAGRYLDNLRRCGSELGNLIGNLYQDPHPRNALAKLDDRTPFLLFPVRLETIFVPAGQESELWVRVYPDDIVVHTHEATLTDTEVEAGELYWTELSIAEYLGSELDRRRAGAWRYLVQVFGGQRAAWIARQTKPSDWDALVSGGATQTLIPFLRATAPSLLDDLRDLAPAGATRDALNKAIAESDGDAFIKLVEQQKWGEQLDAAVRPQILGFPQHGPTKADSWTRAPRTRVLPDRFVLLLFATESGPPREIPGALLPDVLTLGPDPLDAGAGFVDAGGDLKFGPSFDWMSNFDKAVEQGMGFRVPLTRQEASAGFAKVFVLGVRLSADAAESASMLEELIDNHQFGPKGFSIVPQGTPTNNTERDGTGYSDNDPYDDLAFFTETGPPAFDPSDPDPRRSQTDGRKLADVLGISYFPLQTVRYADGTDMLEATAMNAALFPATLGYWLRTWMSPVVIPEAAKLTRSFFNRFVTGRGPAPAIRVGNQPYGILVTSDLTRWKYPVRSNQLVLVQAFDEQTPFLTKLHDLLVALEKTWSGIAVTLPFAGKPGTDSSDVLMNLLGLHPTSVEFFQRIGYSDEYLRNLDSFKDRGRYANELASLMLSMPASARVYFNDLGFSETLGDVGHIKAMHVLWQHYVTSLDAPNLVENRPLSESAGLIVNYIDWLVTAESFDKIVKEQFAGSKQTSLLYLMLRNAVLLQLHHGTFDWLQNRSTFDASLTQAVRETTLPGVSAAKTSVSKYEVMATKVGVVQPSHPAATTAVADLIWRGFEVVDIEAGFAAEQKKALGVLAQATTASLERAFIEHLDCCQYRLDAWETGLFTERLASHRRVGSDDRQTGIYLGAYGWIENLKPSSKTFLRPEDLPTSLRPADSQPILEEDDVISAAGQKPGTKQGGFMHAPSINHASAAALLRNAYLSHADPQKADMFSINLSSERVRRAEFVLQGMRNGQSIEALLGYQFERGLHDRTSESAARGDSPVLELNEFILPYRTAFPFESHEVVQAGTGAPSDTIPAYSVVNGLNLSTAELSAGDGFGLSAVLPAAQRPNGSQGAAILAEREALLDTLDAVKDMLMAENAYQLVQGNFDRAAAVSLAQKEARVPPELQVIETPRGTEFTFTNRVTVHFEDLDPEVPASNPWAAVPLTPRAYAEPGLNQWLGKILTNSPDKVLCEVSREGGADLHRVSIADLGIQPVDFVWMTAIAPQDTGGATEIETRIAYFYRRTHVIADADVVLVKFNPTVAAGELTFAQLFPLARQLRAMVGESRNADAQDFMPAAGGKATTIVVDKTNPQGYDVADLRLRVQSALDQLTVLADGLDGVASPNVQVLFLNAPDDPTDDVAFSGPLGEAFDKLEELKLEFTDSSQLTLSVLISDVESVAATLRRIANFGISDAFPPEADFTDVSARAALLARAYRIARRLRRMEPADGILDRSKALITAAAPLKTAAAQVKLLVEAGSVLFSEAFKMLTSFHYYNDADLALSDAERGQLLAQALSTTPGATAVDVVDEWLQALARVRPQIRRWEVVRLLADALNDVELEIRPVQTPHRAKDSWLAVEFPKNDPLDPTKPFGISRDTLSIAAHGAAAFQAGVRQRAILLDEWTEEIPTSREITGISFRFNQPNAAPPQTLLLAVTPEQTGSWNWDALVGTLTDTLGRAKRRAVEPAQLEKQGLIWNALAPALASEFTTVMSGDVSLDLMAMLDYTVLNDFYARITQG